MIGHSGNLEKHLGNHQTVPPTAGLVTSCGLQALELRHIGSITRRECTGVLNEVFEDAPDGLVQRGNAFFALAARLDEERSLSEHSPLRRGEESV